MPDSLKKPEPVQIFIPVLVMLILDSFGAIIESLQALALSAHCAEGILQIPGIVTR